MYIHIHRSTSNTSMLHIAPAGSSYEGVLHAGNENLIQHCGGFPDEPHSMLIPPIFTSNLMPYIDTSTIKPVPSPELERRELKELTSRLEEDECDRLVRAKLSSIAVKQPSEAILLLSNFTMNQIKYEALAADLPQIRLLLENEEHDYCFEAKFVVFIRNIGIVIIGGDHQKNQDTLKNCLVQLTRIERFFLLLAHAAGCPSLPIAKLAIFPSCAETSLTTDAVHCIYEDKFNNFELCFENILQDLKLKMNSSSFLRDNFKKLVGYGMGLYLLSVIGGGLIQKEGDIPCVKEITRINEEPNMSSNVRIHCESDHKHQSDVHLMPQHSIFHKSNMMKLI